MRTIKFIVQDRSIASLIFVGLLCRVRDGRQRDVSAKVLRRQLGVTGIITSFVRIGTVETQAMTIVKRSPRGTANWALAKDHSRRGMVHGSKARKRIFVAASSMRKWPVARTAIRRTWSGKAQNGTSSAQARRQLWPMAGYFLPQ